MRRATAEEAQAVDAALEGLGAPHRARTGLELAVVEREGVRHAALATPELLQLPPELLEQAQGGLVIGTLEGGSFQLDLQGAVLVAACSKTQTLRVTEHAAQLFLYGRTVLGDSVLWHDPGIGPGEACIVCNARGEALGIGRVVGNFKGAREAVRAVHDLGTYLRDQSADE